MTAFEMFDAAARRHPAAVALEAGGSTLTYAELRTAVENLAGRLRGANRVGLLARRDVPTYVGYLAALRAGAAVVPLNPAFPRARNEKICRLAGVDLIIGAGADVVPGPGGAPAEPETAYVLFTSGTTGTPKGVPITHANLKAYLDHNLARYDPGPGCRFSQTFDLTFDPSVFDMFMAWTSGATLVVPSREELADPVGFVTGRRITHWFSVPSVVSLARRMRKLPPGSMPDLRLSLFAGEQLTVQQARAWHQAAPGSVIENLYGPTELTITCTGYRLPANEDDWPSTPNQTVPIGDVYPHLEHQVLDGELCVRGSQRFRGYLDDADNEGRFVPDDRVTPQHWYRTGDRVRAEPGCGLVHLGRLDHQVKIHGYRVELGEIEAALRDHPAVQDAVAYLDDDDLRVAYTGTRTAPATFTEMLGQRLPRYMVPDGYDWMSELPLNPNGKVDRARVQAVIS
ncbi:AMP-binding protein [Lentzea sp. NPDC005914]|uniref:AMP-binding protein n=1 Tax=Lentzea sp. NPDC005914 TaxID=3154572 RepID=UPI0033D6C104